MTAIQSESQEWDGVMVPVPDPCEITYPNGFKVTMFGGQFWVDMPGEYTIRPL